MTSEAPKEVSATKFISGYLKTRKSRFIAAMVWSILFVITPMQVPVLTGALVDDMHGKHVKLFGFLALTQTHTQIVWFIFAGLTAVAVTYGLAAHFRTTSVAKVSRQIVVQMRKEVVRKLETLSVDIHNKYGSGEMLNRAVLDTATMRPFIENTFIKTSTNIVRVVYPVSMLLIIDPFLTMIAASVVPVQWMITRYLQKKLRKATRKERKTQRRLTALVKENLDGIETIQTSTAERYSIERINKESDAFESDQMETQKYTGMISGIVWSITSFGLALVWWVGGLKVLDDHMTLGTLVAFSGFAVFLYRPSRRFTNLINIYQKGVVAAERVQNLLQMESSVREEPDAQPLKITQGRIQIRDVAFSYHQRKILKGVSLDFEPHTLTVIMGRNGSGKSSLLRLLVRLYDPEGGQILIDDQDIRKVQLESLRIAVAVVPQSPVIFNGTILDNIRLAKPEATDVEVDEACRAAGVLTFAAKWEKGLETVLGDGGTHPSGGERQRIAIARAVIRKPKILLLDEPSSALDLEAESFLMETLKSLREKMTIMMVSHRQRVMGDADRIVLMDDGIVVDKKNRGDISKMQDVYDLPLGGTK